MSPEAPPRIAIVTFSKDRPLQLDGTLRSLAARCSDLILATVGVLYKASAPRYAAGYRTLAAEHPEIRLVPETSFRADLLALVEGSDYVLFVVDDTIFVGAFSLTACTAVLDAEAACLGFSLRLGTNTTYCYPLDLDQRLPAFDEVGPGVLGFRWVDADHDFGYPLEVSSSLYRTSDLLPLLTGLEYDNPNTLETVLSEQAASFARERPRLACFERSVAVSVPANMVQTAWKNRVDSDPALTAEALADAFDRGDRLNVEQYRDLVPNACHQELDLVLRRDPAIPTVSVVMRCYDQARFLPDAVRSVDAQTFTDWEIVVVDDGSPDDTVSVASRLATETSRPLRLVSQANQGLSGAMNAGVAAALGRYILPLDADDVLEPTMLQETVALLEREPGIAIAYTDLQQFGGASAVVQAAEFDAATLPQGNQLSYCALYRREVWDAVGGYNPNMQHGYEDWDFWIGAAERGYVARRIPEVLFRYRVKGDGMFANAKRHDSELRRQIRANHPASFPAEDPAVTVIVPAHNYGHLLRETLKSVREQTFANWECIVIDDGSTDDTPEVLAEVAKRDARISWYSQTKHGLSATRNRGLALSRGRYIQFLDADDLLHRTKLERHVALLDRSDDVEIVYGPTKYFDAADRKRSLRDSFRPGDRPLEDAPIESQAELVERLVARNIMTVAAPLVRSSVFDTVGRFDTTLPRLEDWDLWLRCALAGVRFEYLPSKDAMALIRVHDVSMSASRGPMLVTEARLRYRFRTRLPAALQPMNRRSLRNAARAGAADAAASGARWRGFKIAVWGAYASRDWRLLRLAAVIAATTVPGGTPLVTAVRNLRRRRRHA